MKNYIGKKGYTIKKSDLTQNQLYDLREELNVKPSSNLNGYANNVSFPIYRESTNKIYIPSYYGIDKYGIPNSRQLSLGNKINIEFKGDLYDYQINIINKFLNHVKSGGGGLLDVEPGKGKTVMGLNIISKLNVKTLIVVHKSFLLNQWKERINQFLPDAKVGLIQGPSIDIEDKDIVIGMIQTLTNKKLEYKIIEEFGLTIYDECHHLSAEVFSRVMINISTNYTLGLSGTMTRKDGLTKVFKWFIGPVVHKEKSDTTQEVIVKTIHFADDESEDYNNVETDYRGNPIYSKMITKLCENIPRTDMILNILKYELKNNYDQQIMILAHNKNLINNLYDKILEFEKSTGLYVGGMKEGELKDSEDKKIIIGTYAMASEGLDIKTLTTLLMATPKTDVCQSVGRILRSKHNTPLVIDVIDNHNIFKNQSKKRKKYYVKKKYKIKNYLNLNDYLNDNWREDNKHKNKILIDIN